jgi:hypothetical protein
MYIQKVISKAIRKTNLFFVGILEVTDEKSGAGYRAVNQVYRDKDPDPDPYQNVRDPACTIC